jgi:hypothetical protein
MYIFHRYTGITRPGILTVTQSVTLFWGKVVAVFKGLWIAIDGIYSVGVLIIVVISTFWGLWQVKGSLWQKDIVWVQKSDFGGLSIKIKILMTF